MAKDSMVLNSQRLVYYLTKIIEYSKLYAYNY